MFYDLFAEQTKRTTILCLEFAHDNRLCMCDTHTHTRIIPNTRDYNILINKCECLYADCIILDVKKSR